MRDYAVIYSLWFDFKPEHDQHHGLVVPIDQYGHHNSIHPTEPDKTLLDIAVGDSISDSQRILTVSKVAIFRSTPAPVITSSKPVFEIRSGKDWLKEINEKQVLQGS